MLEVRELSLSVAGETLLTDISFEVGDGEVLSVLGPSGSGKTTLLRAIAGLQPIANGDVTWDGHSVIDLPTHKRGFGLMFQDYALFPHRTVSENVAFGLRMQKHPDIATRVAEVLEMVGMAGFEKRGVGSLSGGEQQRVALARTLAPQPVMLMLDEPLGALDRALREQLATELRQLLSQVGVTALYVTHDQEEAFALGHRIMVLRRGRIVQSGTPEQIWTDPGSEWVATFLGQTTWIDADVRDGGATTSWGRFPVPDIADGRHRLLVRPGALRFQSDGPLVGEVIDFRFLAGRWQVTVDLGGPTPVTVETQSPPKDGRVRLNIDPEQVTTVR
ncbi:MAG: ABC transporter ATP-binding protein [Acidimicrobiia bacterium]